jgi:hypothetical protein
MRPRTLLFLLAIVPFATGLAKDENGMRVEVSKSTISRDDERRRDGYLDKVDRTLGLKIQAKNISMKPLEPGEIEWTIIVERWGYSPARFERYKGKQIIEALKPGESVNLTVGQSPVGGYEGYSKQYQDKMEAWQVVIRHGGKETITVTSGSTFEKANQRAKDAEPR